MPEPRIYRRCFYRDAVNTIVLGAIKHGLLVRPDRCEGCGAVARVDAHHEDYSRWLDVRWLCVRCHRSRHGEMKRLGIDPYRNVKLPAPWPHRADVGLPYRKITCRHCGSWRHDARTCPTSPYLSLAALPHPSGSEAA